MKSTTAFAAILALCLTGFAKPSAVNYPVTGIYNNATGSPILQLIAAAKQTIDIEIYTMGDVKVRTVLRAALARGIHIRVIKDPSPYESDACNVFGSGPWGPNAAANADCQDQRLLASQVRSAGGVYVPFNKNTLCGSRGNTCFEHGKMIVVDNVIALISSGNFDATNFCDSTNLTDRCNRDYTFILDDPRAVATLEGVFSHDVLGQAYDLGALLQSFGNQVLTISQLSLPPLLAFLNSAKHDIRIQNQYLDEPNINNALIAAAHRGVHVMVNVASPCAFGSPSAQEASNFSAIFTAFDAAGIQSSMFDASELIDGHPGYLHAKAIIIDDSQAWVGSINGSSEALTQNREFGIFFNRPDWVNSFGSVIVSDFQSPNGETWQQALHCTKDGTAPAGANEN